MTAVRQTPLHARHLALGAKMGPFAGWDMPIQYDGVRDEHRAVAARPQAQDRQEDLILSPAPRAGGVDVKAEHRSNSQ